MKTNSAINQTAMKTWIKLASELAGNYFSRGQKDPPVQSQSPLDMAASEISQGKSVFCKGKPPLLHLTERHSTVTLEFPFLMQRTNKPHLEVLV